MKTKKNIYYLLLMVIIFIATGWAQHQQSTLFESHLSMNKDSTLTNGGYMGSYFRLQSQFSGQFNVMNARYSLSGGGVYSENLVLNENGFTPEWKLATSISPLSNVSLNLFSQNTQYAAGTFMLRTSPNMESKHGLSFDYKLNNHIRIRTITGIRNITIQDSVESNSFTQFEFSRRTAKTLLLFQNDMNTTNAQTNQRHRLSYSSHLFRGKQSISLISNNHADFKYQSLLSSGELPLFKHHELIWHYSKNDQSFMDEATLNQQSKVIHRYKRFGPVHLENSMINQWVNIDSVDVSHFRNYQSGITWYIHKRNMSTTGSIVGGFREDGLFGSGPSASGHLYFSWHPIQSRWFSLNLKTSSHSTALFSSKIDGEKASYYELDNILDLGTEFFPRFTFTPGYEFSINSHIGSDLTFSPDTLENIYDHTFFIQYRKNRNYIRLNISNRIDLEQDDTALQFTHIHSQLALLKWVHWSGYMSFRKLDNENEFLNIRSTIAFTLGDNTVSLNTNFSGSPDTFGNSHTQLWIQFIRHFR